MKGMFEETGGLSKYWHVIALSGELGRGKSIKKIIYGVPLLLWRDRQNQVFAVVDCCAHKKAPLAVSCFEKNEITCPYHGWKYNKKGLLIDIPGSPHINCSKLGGNLQALPAKEEAGLVWICPNSEKSPEQLPLSFGHEAAWSHTSLKHLFDTSEELLIENFMDATHTPLVHKGLIRGHGKKTEHHVALICSEESVLAQYAETTEKIGMGLRFLLGKNLRIKHSDEFLLPNLVKVDYFINDIHRFNAVIACNPCTTGKTEAIVRLAFNFGKWLNPLIKRVLPWLAKKVIAQDFEITSQQYANQQVFAAQKETPIDSDLMHHKVKVMRRAKIDNTKGSAPSKTAFKLYL